MIFTSLRDYITAAHGPDAATEVLRGEPIHLLSESYADDRFAELLERACAVTGREREELEHEFGVYTAQSTFAGLYPAYFDVARSARNFLLGVETRIHELVRATIPKAAPPRLTVSEHGEDGVSIRYESARHLCVLLRGLTEGTARHYGETAKMVEKTCMRRGDAACTFDVRFARA